MKSDITLNSTPGCGCDHESSAEFPRLDVRSIPHQIRHGAILGALRSVAPGGGLVLIAPHNPLPLLAELEEQEPGAFAVEYLQQGPQDWHLELVRIPGDGSAA